MVYFVSEKTLYEFVAKFSLKFSEFLRINAFRMNHQFREEIPEILRFRGVSPILIFERKKVARNSVQHLTVIEITSSLDLDIDF